MKNLLLYFALFFISKVNGYCIITDVGKLKCWGYNVDGDLGYENKISYGSEPFQMGDNLTYVDLGTDVLVESMCDGGDMKCVVTTEGKVKCWGYNTWGSLGLGLPHNTKIGDKNGDMGDNLPYINLGTNVRVKKIACAYTHVCVVTNDDKVKCWGANFRGQLGLGDRVDRGIEE